MKFYPWKRLWCWVKGHRTKVHGDYSMCWRCGQIKKVHNG